MKFVKGFLLNLQFFTAVPIHIELPMDKKHLASSIKSFPLVGLLQGSLYSLLLYALIHWTPFSILAVAFALWLLTIVNTGGIHLDGWMDTTDAYFSFQDKEKRIEIMKDPRTGAFGVISIIILLSARFLFIYEITTSLTMGSYLLIAFIPMLSKGIMGFVLITVPTAKKDGLASLFQEAGNLRSLGVYPLYLVFALGLFLYLWEDIFMSAVILVMVAIACFGFIRSKAMKWFGGITGDVLGASVEGTELFLWMTLWLLHYFAMV